MQNKPKLRTATAILPSADGRRYVCVDDETADEILSHIHQSERYRKKFQYICELIVKNLKNSELYKRENINETCKDVTAIRLFPGQENDRIYCKEIHGFGKKKVMVVVAARLLVRKTSNKITAREKIEIETVASYQYETIDFSGI